MPNLLGLKSSATSCPIFLKIVQIRETKAPRKLNCTYEKLLKYVAQKLSNSSHVEFLFYKMVNKKGDVKSYLKTNAKDMKPQLNKKNKICR